MNKELRAYLLQNGLKIVTIGPDCIRLIYQDRQEDFIYEYDGEVKDPLPPLLEIFEGDQKALLRRLFAREYKLIESMR